MNSISMSILFSLCLPATVLAMDTRSLESNAVALKTRIRGAEDRLNRTKSVEEKEKLRTIIKNSLERLVNIYASMDGENKEK